jgi:tetratricopeptide (TPR) repeat protein
MRLYVLAFWAALALSGAEKWTKFSSDHFEVLTDGSKGRASSLLAQFERVHGFFAKTIGQQDPMVKPRIVIFDNERAFRAVAPNKGAAAYYMQLPHRDYIVVGPRTGNDDDRVAVHEYVHLLVRHSGLRIPLWLNEGLAELYSTIRADGKQIRVGEPVGHHWMVLQEAWLDPKILLAAEHDSSVYNDPKQQGPFYAMSWAVTHMLSLEPDLQPKFGRFTTLLDNGVEAREALRQAYGLTVEQLGEHVRGYLRQRSVRVAVFALQFEKAAKAAGAEATEFETELALADVSLTAREYERARERLERLAGQFPDKAEPQEGLAVAHLYGKKMAEAGKASLAAYQKGSVNPQVLYLGASLLEGEQRGQFGIGMLDKALEINPGYIEARLRLASLHMLERRPEAAWNAVTQVKKLPPQMVAQYFPVYIQTAWFSEHLEEARSAAAQYARIAVRETDRLAAAKWSEFAAREPRRAPVAVAAVAGSAAAGTGQQMPGELAAFVPFTEALPPEPGEDVIEREEGGLVMRRAILATVEGEFVRLDCLGAQAVFHIRTPDKTWKLRVDDPATVIANQGGSGEIELTCGEQKPRRMRMGFKPEAEGGEADGVIRRAEFLP